MPSRRVASILPALVLVAASIPATAVAGPKVVAQPRQARLVLDTHVDAQDDRFDPTVPRVPRGGAVVFDFVGPSHQHRANDTLLDLYDSGLVSAGGPSVSYTFVAAGVYPFTCDIHADIGMTGRIHVPVSASPAEGSLKRTFTITWASAPAGYGFAYDVRLKRPGRDWIDWRSAVGARNGTFRPHSGKGDYRFEGRLRRTDTGAVSLWSDAATITVG